MQIDSQIIKQANVKDKVKGNDQIYMRIDRKCVSYDEAINVKDGLEAVGYEIKIKNISKYTDLRLKIISNIKDKRKPKNEK